MMVKHGISLLWNKMKCPIRTTAVFYETCTLKEITWWQYYKKIRCVYIDCIYLGLFYANCYFNLSAFKISITPTVRLCFEVDICRHKTLHETLDSLVCCLSILMTNKLSANRFQPKTHQSLCV